MALPTVTVSAASITVTATSAGGNTLDELFRAVAKAGNGTTTACVVGTDGNDYFTLAQAADIGGDKRPITGANWATYWALTGSTGDGAAYVNGTTYPKAYIQKSGANPYTYSIAGQQTLVLNSSTKINQSNAGDILQWNSRTAHSTAIFNVNAGAEYTATSDCVLDFDTSDTYYTYVYWRGKSTLQGTSGHPVVMKHYYVLYNYSTIGNEWDWDYVTLSNMSYGSGYWIQFYSSGYGRASHSFNYLTISGPGGASARGTGMYFSCGFDFSNCTFSNITMDGIAYALQGYFVSAKFYNSTFKNIYRGFDLTGVGGRNYLTSYATTSYPFSTAINQPKITFDTCTFDTNYTLSSIYYMFYYTSNSLVKFKNCTFVKTGGGAAGTGCYSENDSRILWEGTNTFTNLSYSYGWANQGTHYDCKTLTMTVYDHNNIAISGAHVIITHDSANDYWYFRTNGSGQVKDCFGDDPVIPYREQRATSAYVNWSTNVATPGLFHWVMVIKQGFQPWVRKVAFNSDVTIDAVLTPMASGNIPLALPFGGS